MLHGPLRFVTKKSWVQTHIAHRSGWHATWDKGNKIPLLCPTCSYPALDSVQATRFVCSSTVVLHPKVTDFPSKPFSQFPDIQNSRLSWKEASITSLFRSRTLYPVRWMLIHTFYRTVCSFAFIMFTFLKREMVMRVKSSFYAWICILKTNSLWDKAEHNSLWCITSQWYLTTLTPWWCNSFLIILSQSIKRQLQIMHPGKWWRMSRTPLVERLSKHHSQRRSVSLIF